MRHEVLAEGVDLWCGDCREILPTIGKVDAVVTDPPYPNNAGHFIDGIEAARWVLSHVEASHFLVFWTEIEIPPVCFPHVATHIWYRTNTNRPDNYEPIFEFCRDGIKRASRVMPHCVIAPGLTGIIATGHPTEKHPDLMVSLIKRTRGLVFDPFMGSGTTGVACVRECRNFVGCEIDPKYFDIALRRISDELKRPRLALESPPVFKQTELGLA